MADCENCGRELTRAELKNIKLAEDIQWCDKCNEGRCDDCERSYGPGAKCRC